MDIFSAAALDVLPLAPAIKALLADRGYDGDKLRAQIIGLGAKPVIPNKSNRVVIHPFNKRAYKGRNDAASVASKTSAASQLDMTSWLAISSLLFTSPPPSHTGSN